MKSVLNIRRRGDGRWYLMGEPPAEHEFSDGYLRTIAERPETAQDLLDAGVADYPMGTVSSTEVVLNFANARVVYEVLPRNPDHKMATPVVLASYEPKEG